MVASRRSWRRRDGSAAVRGWVAMYTLGLPRAMRERRRDEVTGDLADENLDAVRRGELAGLRRRRLIRWLLGVPADLSWRFLDAPPAAQAIRARLPAIDWVPLTRWSMALVALSAIGSAGALVVIGIPLATGQARPEWWPGLGPTGFLIGCTAVLVGVITCVPWPRRGAMIVVAGALVGFVTAPWLWGCWFVAVAAAALRAYQADSGSSWSDRSGGPR